MAPDLTPGGATAFVVMMEAVTVPPFERFYEEQREPVLVQLRRMLGRDAADDAFQETFLRALRAYPTLKHGRHLRAWALAIARNVAIDAYRRERVTSAEIPDLGSVDEPLPYEELRRLTADLPQKERVAVFLRFGYDLSYEDIGAALGSSSEAARQAASSGVRRLRRKELS
ncbi:MAG TPA: sigma-70 family RNA polymerase sigma factor [Gaiellaceae bacterium]|nr:sigma-70 family RNA polymerase sigma factor [Gaiellaceae bacterium]